MALKFKKSVTLLVQMLLWPIFSVEKLWVLSKETDVCYNEAIPWNIDWNCS